MASHVWYSLCLVFLGAQLLGAQTGTRPDTTELTLIGLELEAEAVEVVRVLGRPDSVRSYGNPKDIGNASERFFYRNVLVFMGADGLKNGVKIIGPGLATRRGLAVGDSVARALVLYGAPDTRNQTELRWRIAARSKPELVVEARRGRVTSVYVGYVTEGLRVLPSKPLPACAPSRAVKLWSNARVAPPTGAVSLRPARDSGFAFDVSITVHDLPAVASLGRYTTFIVWVATPSLEDFRSLGAIENEKPLTARVGYSNVLFLVSAEPDVTGTRWTGPIVLAGRCS